MMPAFKPIPLEMLKTQRPRHYQKVTISLATARTNELFWVVGDFIGVGAITGSCAVRINELNHDEIDLQICRRIYTGFYRFYITNTAQAGKSMTLYIGGDASFKIEVAGKTGIINAAGTDINPATEDTLALIQAKTDNLEPLATTPAIYNVTMTDADTEYSQALPAGTKKFSIALIENDLAFRVAFVTGKVATPTAPYKPVPIAQEYYEESVNLTGETLYFACSSAGKNVVIIAWT